MAEKDAETLLRSLYYAQRRVELDEERLESLRARLRNPGVNYSKPVVHGGTPQNVGDAIINIVGLEEHLQASIVNRNAIARQALALIEAVDNEQYQLLLALRYRDFWKWDEIGARLGYSRPGLHKLHRRALKAAEIKYSELSQSLNLSKE